MKNNFEIFCLVRLRDFITFNDRSLINHKKSQYSFQPQKPHENFEIIFKRKKQKNNRVKFVSLKLRNIDIKRIITVTELGGHQHVFWQYL